MADGSIRIIIDVDGRQVEVASDSLDNLEAAGRRAGRGTGEVGEGIKQIGEKSKGAAGSVKTFATSLGLVEIGKAAFRTLASSMDAAISRFDTLNKFPKVLQGLGVSAEDSKRAMDNLSDGISGLPTLLNEISVTAQRMYTSFNDIDKATDTALGLNNALLASGASAGDAQRGTEQYLKILQTGKVDMQTWTSLQQTMSLGLVKVSEAFGMTEREMYNALQSGEVSIDAFNDKLIELGTGTGLLADLARENTLGIATSFGNLKVAAARGLTHIIEKFDELSKEMTGKDIAQNIDSMKVIVFKAFTVVGSVIEKTTPIVKGFATGVSAATSVVKVLSPAIMGLMAAYAAYTVIAKTTAAIQGANKILVIAQASQHALTIAVKAQTAAQAEQTGMIGLSTAAIGLLTGKLTVAKVATAAQTAATKALAAAKAALKGPVGIASLALGLLVTGIVAAVKWFKRSTKEANEFKAEMEELSEATNQLVGEIDGSARAYEDNQQATREATEYNRRLAEEIEDLAGKESLLAVEKTILNDKIQELNESVDGLNLAYDEETGLLNMSSEAIKKRIDLMHDEVKYTAAKERLVEIEKERIKIESQQAVINAEKEKANDLVDDGVITLAKYKKEVKDLNEQEQELIGTLDSLAIQQAETERQMVNSIDAIAQAASEGIHSQIIDFENLDDAQKEAIDNMRSAYEDLADSATDAFKKIDTKTEHTMKSMTDTLQHNQKVVEEWGENQAKLMKWAGENGYDNFVPYIESLGIDSAAELAVLAKASDTELEKFAGALESGAEIAGESMKKSLGDEFDEVIDQMVDWVQTSSATMKEQMEAAGFDKIGKIIPESLEESIIEGTPGVEKATGDMAKAGIESAKDELEISSPSRVFVGMGDGITEGLAVGIDSGTNKVIDTMESLLAKMIASFDSIEDDFETIGENAMAGLDAGLEGRRSLVMTTAKNIANEIVRTMEAALDIASPAGATMIIGEQIGEGLAVGMDSKQQDAGKSAEDLAKTVADILTKNLAEMNADIEKLASDHAAEIERLEKRHAEDVQSIRTRASEKKRALTHDETLRIKRMIEDHNKKIIDLEEKTAKERERIAKDSSKRLIDIAENHVAEMKFWQGMSIKQEAEYWYQMYAALEVGTDEYERAMKNHQAVVKRARSEMESINEYYTGRIIAVDTELANNMTRLSEEYKKASTQIREKLISDTNRLEEEYERASVQIQQKLVDDINQLNEAYRQAYEQRTKDLANVTKLFDKFVKGEQVAGEVLIQNLKSQVDALKDYTHVINSLDERIDNDALIAELRALGTDSLAELEALYRMSDSQLAEYVALYEQRFGLASEQATKELEPLKAETQEQIKALNNIADKELAELKDNFETEMQYLNEIADEELRKLKNNFETDMQDLNITAERELDELERTWTSKIADLVLGTKEEFDQLYYVGTDAIQGLEDGILSRESSVKDTVIRIANSAVSTIKSALGILSPSSVMRDEVGQPIPEGIALGIREKSPLVYAELNKMTAETRRILAALPVIAKTAMENMLNEIKDGGNKIMRYLSELATRMVEAFDGLDDELVIVGQDAMSGLSRGLELGRPGVMAMAKSIARDVTRTLRSALKISSPSRITVEIGEQVSEGLAVGMENKLSLVEQAAAAMADAIKDVMDRTAQLEKDTLERHEEFWTRLESIADDGGKKYKSTYDYYVRQLIAINAKMVDDMNRDLIEGIRKIDDEIRRAQEEYAWTLANRIKELTNLGGLFKKFEITAPTVERSGGGSGGRTNLADEIEKLRNEYLDSSEQVRKKLTKDIKAVNEAYTQAYDKRVKQLTDITGLFDKYQRKTKVPETALIRHLQSQVDALEDYSKTMTSLESKIDNEALIAELHDLGPDSLAELEALNRMNDEQLAEFVALYEQRFALASERAIVEMKPLKDETTEQIRELNIVAEKELADLQANLEQQIKEAGESIRREVSSAGSGIMAEFKSLQEELLHNLRTQIEALKEYAEVINSLGEKIDNENLMAELRELGVGSLEELRALNDMTAEQLAEFVELYEERFALASEQAEKELGPMKDEVAQQIEEMSKAAQEELDKVEKDWTEAIRDIVASMTDELEGLYEVGSDAVLGLIDGLNSQAGELARAAKDIAKSVTDNMKTELDISSPSQVMRDKIGKMIPAGIALGIKDNAKLAYKEMKKLAKNMIVGTPEQALRTNRMAYAGMTQADRTKSISHDNRRSYSPSIVNYFTPAESTPSESARKQKQQQQRLAMEWGY